VNYAVHKSQSTCHKMNESAAELKRRRRNQMLKSAD
jgi:hypothetical protein